MTVGKAVGLRFLVEICELAEILNSDGSFPASLSSKYLLLAYSRFFWLTLGEPAKLAYVKFGGPATIFSGSMKLFLTVPVRFIAPIEFLPMAIPKSVSISKPPPGLLDFGRLS